MKFLHLTGIIVLLSQATSISAAMLFPRSSSGSGSVHNPLDHIRAAIKKIKESRTPLESPDNKIKQLAKKLNFQFLIPIHVCPELNKNRK
ncbi:unnamed protein product [Blumeria hordei]|uniref:Uncharacterized protein n=1 Tax=Blumeria hordei TaxID=2867405 RepID=A0A383UTZ8_BLUHO|nr:unnamed protein product [Blumeria hordei]